MTAPRKERYYVTTPIYYVNDVPHLGTAYTTIVADALARYYRARGRDVFFLTGLDEHGLKIEEAARAAGEEPRAYVDRMATPFIEAWKTLDVRYDQFIRTTEEDHERRVQGMWRKVRERGDIYLGEFEGPYCVACEGYYTEKDLVDGLCPVHGKPVPLLKEASYFFKLSAYGDRLLDFYERHPGFVAPEGRFNEVKSFVREGLRDLSVSRTSFQWGVPVPDDPNHVMYVWFDALANYWTALGDPDGERYRTFWPPDVHLVGKDILRFHAVYWPAFLLSAGMPEDALPRQVFAHGWLTVNGEKMSKSLRNAVSPNLLAGVFGADAIRYYLLREVALGQDGDVSFKAIVSRWNNELGNDLGNLVNRTVALCHRLTEGRVPAGAPDPEVVQQADEARARTEDAWEALQPHRALEHTWSLCRFGNAYLDKRAPWALAKQGKKEEVDEVLRNALELARWIALLVGPVMPAKSRGILEQLASSPDAEPWPAEWPGAWLRLRDGAPLPPPQPLFPRIDADREREILASLPGAPQEPKAQATNVSTAAPVTATATNGVAAPVAYDDFMRVELRVGIVREAVRVPKSDKLLKLQVDVGEDTPRQIVAGIGKAVDPDALIGRRVVVVANLAPRKIFGLESRGMLLAAGDETTLQVVTFAGEVPPGTRVK